MITLSNGHAFRYMVASGALAFDGKGWLWERPLVWTGLIRPELFTVVLKTLTRHPRPGNLRWWKPWESVQLIPGGSVNKVGLTNPGIDHWCCEKAAWIDYAKFPTVGSIFGNKDELRVMADMLNPYDLVGIEVNVSCPNTGHAMDHAGQVVSIVQEVKAATRHPIIIKVSVDQNYCAIAEGLKGIAGAISLNSVPWTTAFPDGRPSPLARLERRVGGGGGGVSGKPAQAHNWAAVRALAEQGSLPVIGPSIMQYEDIARLREMGANALSFGAIHLRTPWRPTSFVRRDMMEQSASQTLLRMHPETSIRE